MIKFKKRTAGGVPDIIGGRGDGGGDGGGVVGGVFGVVVGGVVGGVGVAGGGRAVGDVGGC